MYLSCRKLVVEQRKDPSLSSLFDCVVSETDIGKRYRRSTLCVAMCLCKSGDQPQHWNRTHGILSVRLKEKLDARPE